MSALRDHTWQSKYHSDAGSLVKQFYEPALACALRYDRTSGYFTAGSLTLAARGVEHLIRNKGRMRLIVGCTLDADEVDAIKRGLALREAIGAKVSALALQPIDPTQSSALELLAWMVAQGVLDVKVAIPCGADRKLIASDSIFHEKAGVIEDASGDRIAFNGSINETARAWSAAGPGNWESFHVFTSYDGTSSHVTDEEDTFARLWSDKAHHLRVIDVPTALREELLRFLPKDGVLPQRLLDVTEPAVDTKVPKAASSPPEKPESAPTVAILPDTDELRRRAWAVVRGAPAWPNGGEWVGEATSAVVPWPHQIRAFQRMYDNWPPKLLVADEVGLGKTIEAGLLLRQAWLSGRAKRILILTPRAVLNQWQIELRDKFNLNWPVYDGQALRWYPCRALAGTVERQVAGDEWHREPVVLASSHLMRRTDRAAQLLAAEPWDLVVLDEAHHARRRGAGSPGKDKGPNHLLKLMQQLKSRTKGLVLLTATPMQVHPVEVWDLLDLLGLPPYWTAGAFEKFFQLVGQPSPSHEDFEFLTKMFREAEAFYGPVSLDAANGWLSGSSLASKKVIQALRDDAQNPRRQLPADRRKAAIAVMKTSTPVGRLISRHTRELLRKYQGAGKITSRIATRKVIDDFVVLTPDERRVYEEVENYISSTYDNASDKDRSAVGFVMTIYRRRLASSFAALRHTLTGRLAAVERNPRTARESRNLDDDVSDDETAEEVMDVDDAARLEQQSLAAEEASDVENLLRDVKALPVDTKAKHLVEWIKRLVEAGYPQAIVFTQYTDTMDFLRDWLRKNGISVMCYSGRGGEVTEASGAWRSVSREETKRLFRDKKASVLLATDAAAEGLNFQFCGALVNYDMPWNPMRVEQRIGRIDRLGQAFEQIRIVNLHYDDTVETDVYRALRDRIGLFSSVVGKMQPILAALPRQIAEMTLRRGGTRDRDRADLVQQLDSEIQDRRGDAFDLDEIALSELDAPARPAPPYDLQALDTLLRRPDLLPPAVEVKRLTAGEYELTMPGMKEPLRVTTSRDRFEENPGTYELWSPGSPLFPARDAVPPPNEEVKVPLRDITSQRL
jgi:SNF2 family DNA or RNA helicase